MWISYVDIICWIETCRTIQSYLPGGATLSGILMGVHWTMPPPFAWTPKNFEQKWPILNQKLKNLGSGTAPCQDTSPWWEVDTPTMPLAPRTSRLDTHPSLHNPKYSASHIPAVALLVLVTRLRWSPTTKIQKATQNVTGRRSESACIRQVNFYTFYMGLGREMVPR